MTSETDFETVVLMAREVLEAGAAELKLAAADDDPLKTVARIYVAMEMAREAFEYEMLAAMSQVPSRDKLN